MGRPTVPDSRCAQCAAALRPGAPWCTQCYARTDDPTSDAGPVADVESSRTPAAPAAAPVHAPPAAPAASQDAATWPCEACGARTPLADACCAHCGTAFLAHARGARPALVLPLVGDVTTLTPVRLVVLSLVLVVGLLLAGLAGGALLG